VLRATGKMDDAAALENEELAGALTHARIATNNSDDEAAILAEEAERVSSATVLAELLAPMLAEHLRAESLPAQPPPVAVAPASSEPKPRVNRPTVEKAPGIADLIDGMLSQRPPPPTKPLHP
jgi:hypothetical protein